MILERFGRFWGAFSVIDLFLLNALTRDTSSVPPACPGNAAEYVCGRGRVLRPRLNNAVVLSTLGADIDVRKCIEDRMPGGEVK